MDKVDAINSFDITVQPFTIQGMIDAAQEGEVVLVPPGTYNEHVLIDKTITLRGTDKNTTTITYTSSEENPYAPINGKGKEIFPGFFGKGPPFTVENLTIINNSIHPDGGGGSYWYYDGGVSLWDCQDTKIDNCIFKDSPCGVIVYVGNAEVINCEFYGCADEGVAFTDSIDNKVAHCNFHDNAMDIELQAASVETNALIEYCTFTNTSSCIAGIHALPKTIIVNNCTFALTLSPLQIANYGTSIFTNCSLPDTGIVSISNHSTAEFVCCDTTNIYWDVDETSSYTTHCP